MKKLSLLFTALILCLTTIAQSPQAISYQSLARTADGDPVVNQDISVKISILSGSASGASIYSELHNVTTNSMGLFNLQVGNPGLVISGNFNEIAWGANDYFLKVEIDENGGNNLVQMGITQLLSVPYALYSENTAHPEDADADPINELQTVTETDYIVNLSQGGGSFMTGVKSYTQAQIDTMTPYNGFTVHNATTNCINYYFMNAWYKTCGTCTPLPSVAFAGNDLQVQGGSDGEASFNLEANTPESGLGSWSILSGTGGTFEDATEPNTLFFGQNNHNYTLQWSVGTPCDTTYDQVNIEIFPAVGDDYQGGYIVCFFWDGHPGYVPNEVHGMIALHTDFTDWMEWGCEGTEIGGTSMSYGTGPSNTSAIVAGCSSWGFAAWWCDISIFNGYDDWYLPSLYELQHIYYTYAELGFGSNFTNFVYWCSTEYDADHAWSYNFVTGEPSSMYHKSLLCPVRPVRSF
nr:DUF1566 domain-containing protein [Bacteroidota bacterium]